MQDRKRFALDGFAKLSRLQRVRWIRREIGFHVFGGPRIRRPNRGVFSDTILGESTFAKGERQWWSSGSSLRLEFRQVLWMICHDNRPWRVAGSVIICRMQEGYGLDREGAARLLQTATFQEQKMKDLRSSLARRDVGQPLRQYDAACGSCAGTPGSAGRQYERCSRRGSSCLESIVTPCSGN